MCHKAYSKICKIEEPQDPRILIEKNKKLERELEALKRVNDLLKKSRDREVRNILLKYH